MAWRVTPYAAALGLAAVVAGGIMVYTSRRRDRPGAVPVLGILTAAVVWSIADALRLSTTDVGSKLLLNSVRFLGPVLVTVSVFLFAATYTDRDEWLRPRRVTLVCAPHALTLSLVWTNGFHRLVRRGYTVSREGGMVFVDIAYGPWYYVHAAYSYLLLVVAAAFLVAKLRGSGDVRTFRNQTVTVLAAQFVPWGLNAAFVTGLTENDLTPLGFTVTGLFFAVALFRYRVLDLVPIARSTVVDTVGEGYVVLDTSDTLVDINDTACEVLRVDRNDAVGASFRTVFGQFPPFYERFGDERAATDRIEVAIDGERRYYDVDVSPIFDGRDTYTGRVVLFRDVTDRQRRKERLQRQKERLEHQTAQLERQNERLEEFASVVSHDLRNPLNVVSGRLELARDAPEPEHFDEMEAGLERMERIVEDVLTMARQGQTVGDTEPVAVAEVAEAAWGHVDTGDAVLVVDVSRVVDADRDRLLQVFENLFRNAVEHGSTGNQPAADDAVEHGSTSPASGSRQDAVEHGGADVTVTVGDLADGFYVADDGPGIPETERDRVFQKGHSGADDGTGFGLAIVETAVEAHGWSVRVTESADGGARFEITGVDRRPLEDAEPDPATQD